jgi:quercetin dioxygenase-like cupin family protein
VKFLQFLAIFGAVVFLAAQTPSKAIVVNLKTANWTREKGAPPETEGVMIRSDPATGASYLLARYPAGHVIKPHFHDSNEHIFVAEGQLTLTQDNGPTVIDVGGFAFLPAHEVQRIACTSSTRCSFYLSWEGNPKSHPAP